MLIRFFNNFVASASGCRQSLNQRFQLGIADVGIGFLCRQDDRFTGGFRFPFRLGDQQRFQQRQCFQQPVRKQLGIVRQTLKQIGKPLEHRGFRSEHADLFL